MEEIIEIMATVEHTRWSNWQSHLHNMCDVNQFGNWILPENLREQWQRQIDTPYSELSDSEKESDRREVRNTLEALKKAGYTIVPLATNSNK